MTSACTPSGVSISIRDDPHGSFREVARVDTLEEAEILHWIVTTESMDYPDAPIWVLDPETEEPRFSIPPDPQYRRGLLRDLSQFAFLMGCH